MALKNLLEAIANEGQTPCQKFSCQNFQRCADERLACFAFGYFVETGRTVHPHIFPVPGASGDERLVNVGQVHPARKWFDDIENDRLDADGVSAWDQKRAAKAKEDADALMDERGAITLDTWLTTSVARAETTLRRAAKSEGEI